MPDMSPNVDEDGDGESLRALPAAKKTSSGQLGKLI